MRSSLRSRIDEIVAIDLRLGLELAVDAAVALLKAAGVPRHVEMEQVPAVGLEIEPLAGGVGGNQDAERVFPGVGRERALDLLALRGRRRAVIDGDPVGGPVGGVDGGRKLLMEVTLGVVILGEDQDARCRSTWPACSTEQMLPSGGISGHMLVRIQSTR